MERTRQTRERPSWDGSVQPPRPIELRGLNACPRSSDSRGRRSSNLIGSSCGGDAPPDSRAGETCRAGSYGKGDLVMYTPERRGVPFLATVLDVSRDRAIRISVEDMWIPVEKQTWCIRPARRPTPAYRRAGWQPACSDEAQNKRLLAKLTGEISQMAPCHCARQISRSSCAGAEYSTLPRAVYCCAPPQCEHCALTCSCDWLASPTYGLRRFAKYGVEINGISAAGVSPLLEASRCGQLRVVAALLEMRANATESAGQNRWTPLHDAAQGGRIEICRALLRAESGLVPLRTTGPESILPLVRAVPWNVFGRRVITDSSTNVQSIQTGIMAVVVDFTTVAAIQQCRTNLVDSTTTENTWMQKGFKEWLESECATENDWMHEPPREVQHAIKQETDAKFFSYKATYNFEPESVKLLGIVCDADGYVTKVLDDSQAKDTAIKTWYRIVTVETEEWKEDGKGWHGRPLNETLARARDGDAAYRLTFEVGHVIHVAVPDFAQLSETKYIDIKTNSELSDVMGCLDKTGTVTEVSDSLANSNLVSGDMLEQSSASVEELLGAHVPTRLAFTSGVRLEHAYAKVYHRILSEFLGSGLSKLSRWANSGNLILRLPVLGTCQDDEQVPSLNRKALVGGFALLSHDQQQCLVNSGVHIDLCVPTDSDFLQFARLIRSHSICSYGPNQRKKYLSFGLSDSQVRLADDSSSRQRWVITKLSAGQYIIQNVEFVDGPTYLGIGAECDEDSLHSVDDSGREQRRMISITPAEQRWSIFKNADSSYSIQSCDGDAYLTRTDSGVELCEGSTADLDANQRWFISDFISDEDKPASDRNRHSSCGPCPSCGGTLLSHEVILGEVPRSINTWNEVFEKEIKTALKKVSRERLTVHDRNGRDMRLIWNNDKPELSVVPKEFPLQIKGKLSNAVNFRSCTEGTTPFLEAAAGGFEDIIQEMLHHGALVNSKREDGTTALMLAAGRGDRETCELLIHSGCYLCVPHKNPATQPEDEIPHGCKYWCRDPRHRPIANFKGDSALSIAQGQAREYPRYAQVVKLLNAHGVK